MFILIYQTAVGIIIISPLGVCQRGFSLSVKITGKS
jgi:hypothetical protein